MPFTGERAESSAPGLGLNLSMTHQYRDVHGTSGGARYEGEAVDLGFAPDGKASLRLAGQEVTGHAARLGYDDEGGKKRGFKWWIPAAIVGVVAVGTVGFFIYAREVNKSA